MSNYSIRRHGSQFMIYENTTKQYVVAHTNEKCAKEACQKLNSGAAFDGATPPFFARNLLILPIKD